MIALLTDEDFNARIIRGLFRRIPDLNLLTVIGAGLEGQDDAIVISWAAINGRLLLTHDLNTMIDAPLDRVRTGQSMPGLVAVPQQLGIGDAIFDLTLVVACAEANELEGQILYLPLLLSSQILCRPMVMQNRLAGPFPECFRAERRTWHQGEVAGTA